MVPSFMKTEGNVYLAIFGPFVTIRFSNILRVFAWVEFEGYFDFQHGLKIEFRQ